LVCYDRGMDIKVSQLKKVFFYGIGGIGISAIVRMMIEGGKHVVGQDTKDSENIEHLRELGAVVTIGQSIDAIPTDTDLIVYSRAIEVLEPEFLKAIKALNIPSLVYPEMLGLVSKDMYTIAVSGSHGKTTTTGMVAHMLQKLDADPTVVIGSFLQGSQSNFIQGKVHNGRQLFVVEADEYHRAFLNLHPNIVLITNIDLDHVDYYKDLDDIKSAYKTLVEKVPTDGYVVCDTANADVQDIIKNVVCTVVDYKEYLYERALTIPGRHNQIDATLAYCVGHLLGYDKDVVDTALATFPGTWRRFEYKGITPQGTLVYDDYAHHPTEVRASLQAFREKFPKGEYKLHVFFQPHLFSRTKALFTEFTSCFTDADEVVLLPIFRAREIDDGTISSEILAQAIGTNTIQALSFDEAKTYLKNKKEILTNKDVIITMGAGEAYEIGDEILK
jgi:UDP-N-acetylmuramate--alanine ligase